MTRPPLASYALLAASMALVGSYVGLSKLLVAVFPVFLLAWLRFGVAALAMAGWLHRRENEPALSRSDAVLLFWESFLGNFLFSTCMLFGVAFSSAVSAGVIMAAIPAAVALLSWLWLGERITPRVAAGIGLAVAGIALLALTRRPDIAGDGDHVAVGHALLLAAVFCEASYVVIGKRLAGRVSPQRISAIINLWGLALVTPMGIAAAWSFDFRAVGGGAWALLVFYALAASVFSVWLWMSGLRGVPAASAGVFTVMLPVGAAAVGVGVLGEPFSAPQAAALGTALMGLVLATWPIQRANASASSRR